MVNYFRYDCVFYSHRMLFRCSKSGINIVTLFDGVFVDITEVGNGATEIPHKSSKIDIACHL